MIGWRDAGAQGVFHEEAAALKKPGMVDTFRLTVKHEGVRALYKGLVPNSLKVGNQHRPPLSSAVEVLFIRLMALSNQRGSCPTSSRWFSGL
jgi:hypothetical protein